MEENSNGKCRDTAWNDVFGVLCSTVIDDGVERCSTCSTE